MISYQEFIKAKTRSLSIGGFTPTNLNDNLFEFQRHCVTRACQSQKFALFLDCGMGKTICQLEWANQVSNYEGLPVLILAPLAVVGQTIREGSKFGIDVSEYGEGLIQIVNYEQIDNIDTSIYCGVVLDESSIMKSFTGKIRNKIIERFAHHKYKLCCTATPSPNDPMELGNHSEFLDQMTRTEMLSMYFVHDGGNTSKWRIKGHAIGPFYQFVSQWAIMASNPSDIGYPMEGYDLPSLNMYERQVQTEYRNNGMLFNDIAVNATNFNQELRLTLIKRVDEVVDIVNGSDENFIVWVKQNKEGEYLTKMINGAVEVKGSDTPEYKRDKLLGFADNDFRVLVTKAKIAQFGLNYQNCNNQVFAAIDFSFEGLYQAIRRSYRFGQKKPVNIYLITTDTMQNVVSAIKEKQAQFEYMQKQMINNQTNG